MIEFFLRFIYFIRPVGFVYVPMSMLGLNLFEWLTFFTVLVLLLVAIARSHLFVRRPLDSLDRVMIFLIFWCLVVSVIRYEVTDFRLLMKWILPFVLYVLLRKVILNPREYLLCLRAMILGFLVVVVVNSVVIFRGGGLIGISYWTGLARYYGLYQGSHEFGHNMAFIIMLIPAYFILSTVFTGRSEWKKKTWVLLASIVLFPLAIYGLFKSGVRTAIVGVVVYSMVLLFIYSKRLFALYIISASAALVIGLSFFTLLFSDLPGLPTAADKGIASGRPDIWRHNLKIFSDLDIGEKMIGIGPGNILTSREMATKFQGVDMLADDEAMDSHNDFLKALMETGIVGLLAVVVFYLMLMRKALAIAGPARAVYVAIIAAVIIMNIASNSYLSRFGMGQMFAMLMLGLDMIGIKAQHGSVARNSRNNVGNR